MNESYFQRITLNNEGSLQKAYNAIKFWRQYITFVQGNWSIISY